MLSYSMLLAKYLTPVPGFRQCVLTYTLTQTQLVPRLILERNLKAGGWRKIGYSQQTLWMAQKRQDEFMLKDCLGRLIFDRSKIKKIFSSYFAGVRQNYRVKADFVLFVGDAGKCAVKYYKPGYLPAQINYRTF